MRPTATAASKEGRKQRKWREEGREQRDWKRDGWPDAKFQETSAKCDLRTELNQDERAAEGNRSVPEWRGTGPSGLEAEWMA